MHHGLNFILFMTISINVISHKSLARSSVSPAKWLVVESAC